MTAKEPLGEPVSRPSIAYVDEVKDEQDNFFTDAFDSGLFENIYILSPEPNIDDLINKILDLQIDALITDFNLSEAGPLSYNGEQLVSAFLAIRSDFPCFIRTSYDDDALALSDDVNRIYSKNIVNDESAGRYLFKRISIQIDHHQRRIVHWQNELAELRERDPVSLTAADVERIIELDTKVEISFGRDIAIPTHVKKEVLLNKERQLIEETDRLIADIKRALGE